MFQEFFLDHWLPALPEASWQCHHLQVSRGFFHFLRKEVELILFFLSNYSKICTPFCRRAVTLGKRKKHLNSANSLLEVPSYLEKVLADHFVSIRESTEIHSFTGPTKIKSLWTDNFSTWKLRVRTPVTLPTSSTPGKSGMPVSPLKIKDSGSRSI